MKMKTPKPPSIVILIVGVFLILTGVLTADYFLLRDIDFSQIVKTDPPAPTYIIIDQPVNLTPQQKIDRLCAGELAGAYDKNRACLSCHAKCGGR